MSEFKRPNDTNASPDPDYELKYEYYDDEEPVSFEGLKAHRYSIVIGFWVGLAVFVIFMFFVLTLLTKTGAPHPEGAEPCEKRVHLISCVEDLSHPPNPDNIACPSHPLLDSSRSLFQCYINEEEHGGLRGPSARAGDGGDLRAALGRRDHNRASSTEEEALGLQDDSVAGNRTERETVLLAHFNIPNFVNSEHSSILGEDDLLLGEPELPIILEGAGQTSSDRHMID